MKQVLVLGSGLVAQPLVRHLLAKGHRVVIATLLLDRAAEMIAGHPNGKALLLDVEDEARLASFIAACERDMIALCHDFRIEFPDGKRERIQSQLINFGVPSGDTSMSRAVSLPAAISVEMILTGRIQRTGVLRPITQDIYNPVLDELASLGITCQEKTEAF
jgi:saccharopine dehydrogenase-like NADP-dependent oxidoreductase